MERIGRNPGAIHLFIYLFIYLQYSHIYKYTN